MANALRAVATALCVLCLSFASIPGPPAVAAPSFGGYEVRVIRPRYFIKDDKLELTGGTSVVMNQSFIYSLLVNGILAWHFSETLAVEAQVSYGGSFDKREKRILADDFAIHTVLLRTESLASTRLLWTPSYGKYHLGTSQVVYFDTYLTAGVGTTGIRYQFDHCEGAAADAPSKRRQYPTFVLGLGQRHFIDKQTSFRISGELQRFAYDLADGACEPDALKSLQSHDNVILSLGWSKFL